jgi:hypothetical protein
MKYTLFRQVIYFRLADDLYKKCELKEDSRKMQFSKLVYSVGQPKPARYPLLKSLKNKKSDRGIFLRFLVIDVNQSIRTNGRILQLKL